MAKKTKLSPLILSSVACLVMSAAWLMRLFPVLIFVGLSPLFAIMDKHGGARKSFLIHAELILTALSVSLWSATFFDVDRLATTLVEAIGLTLSFMAFMYCRQVLGARNKLVLILFWMTTEYIFLVILGDHSIFLADALQFVPQWTRWNGYTGYLGTSVWILLSNLLFYHAALKDNKVNWPMMLLFVACLATPLLMSLTSVNDTSVARKDMLDLFETGLPSPFARYNEHAEFLPRTAAWVSVLILLFTFVKSKTRRS